MAVQRLKGQVVVPEVQSEVRSGAWQTSQGTRNGLARQRDLMAYRQSGKDPLVIGEALARVTYRRAVSIHRRADDAFGVLGEHEGPGRREFRCQGSDVLGSDHAAQLARSHVFGNQVPDRQAIAVGRHQPQRAFLGLNPHCSELSPDRGIGNREAHLLQCCAKEQRLNRARPSPYFEIPVQFPDGGLDSCGPLTKRSEMCFEDPAPLLRRCSEVLPNSADRHLRCAKPSHERRPVELTNRVVAVSRLFVDQLRTQQVVLVVETQRTA